MATGSDTDSAVSTHRHKELCWVALAILSTLWVALSPVIFIITGTLSLWTLGGWFLNEIGPGGLPGGIFTNPLIILSVWASSSLGLYILYKK